MAVGDDIMEDLLLSSGMNSVGIEDGESVLSEEDAVWADSCLTKDPEILECEWNSLNDLLLESANIDCNFSAHGKDNFPNRVQIGNLSSSEETIDVPLWSKKIEAKAQSGEFWSKYNIYNPKSKDLGSIDPELDLAFQAFELEQSTINVESNSSGYGKEIFPNKVEIDYISPSEQTANTHNSSKINGAEPNSDDSLNNKNTDDFWSRYSMEDIFLPTYNEKSRDLGSLDPEMDLAFEAFTLEQSTEDIFKIWDLEIPGEEEYLTKQLNKTLGLEPRNPAYDDSKAWQALKDVSIDDIISGIADLSLTPISD